MPRARKERASNNGLDNERLKRLDERYTRLDKEMEDIKEGIKDILLEMKSAGYDTKLYKKAVQIRKIGFDEFIREHSELSLYLDALEVNQTRDPELVY